MKRIHVWIGTFKSEEDFNKYFDQTVYFQAWNKYNNEPPEEGEEDIEPGDEVRCPFCKEIGMEWYDEDFTFMHYEQSGDFNALLNRLPADSKKILLACKEKKVRSGNAFFIYSAKEMDEDINPENSHTITYIGEFEEAISSVLVGEESLQGLTNHLFAGVTNKTKEEFMEYFNQNGKQCQFCKDVEIKNYNSNALYVYHGKLDSVEKIIKSTLPDKHLYDSMFSELEDKNIKEVNALFCYIDNAYRDKKKDQTFLIYKKDFVGFVKKTNKFIDEKDNYNDLMYIGAFEWD
jgi:hypothetical protein